MSAIFYITDGGSITYTHIGNAVISTPTAMKKLCNCLRDPIPLMFNVLTYKFISRHQNLAILYIHLKGLVSVKGMIYKDIYQA